MSQCQPVGSGKVGVWGVADLLRGDAKAHEYGQVILPLGRAAAAGVCVRADKGPGRRKSIELGVSRVGVEIPRTRRYTRVRAAEAARGHRPRARERK